MVPAQGTEAAKGLQITERYGYLYGDKTGNTGNRLKKEIQGL